MTFRRSLSAIVLMAGSLVLPVAVSHAAGIGGNVGDSAHAGGIGVGTQGAIAGNTGIMTQGSGLSAGGSASTQDKTDVHTGGARVETSGSANDHASGTGKAGVH